jgi:3-mercaptopyruvate sulfurtransferase SseA
MPTKRKKSSNLPLILIVGGGVLLLGSLAYYGYQASQPLPTIVASQPAVGSTTDIARVSLADAKAAYDLGSAVFVDVRDAQAYAAQHIPGAVSIPLNELAQRLGELDPEDWIIPY